MEYNYVLTIEYDGKELSTFRLPDFTTASDSWNKCVDSGDAKTYAKYELTDPTGKTFTKMFYNKKG